MSNNFETVRDRRNMSMNHDYKTGISLSDSVNKTCVKRSNHNELLSGWHASQIKRYYRTLSGSHGRSFRIRQEKSSEAPHGGEITMTSYAIGNKTSLSG